MPRLSLSFPTLDYSIRQFPLVVICPFTPFATIPFSGGFGEVKGKSVLPDGGRFRCETELPECLSRCLQVAFPVSVRSVDQCLRVIPACLRKVSFGNFFHDVHCNPHPGYGERKLSVSAPLRYRPDTAGIFHNDTDVRMRPRLADTLLDLLQYLDFEFVG